MPPSPKKTISVEPWVARLALRLQQLAAEGVDTVTVHLRRREIIQKADLRPEHLDPPPVDNSHDSTVN